MRFPLATMAISGITAVTITFTYSIYNGTPCITLTDNYYNDTITRAPGLMRYGYSHSFNNYVVDFDVIYDLYGL